MRFEIGDRFQFPYYNSMSAFNNSNVDGQAIATVIDTMGDKYIFKCVYDQHPEHNRNFTFTHAHVEKMLEGDSNYPWTALPPRFEIKIDERLFDL